MRSRGRGASDNGGQPGFPCGLARPILHVTGLRLDVLKPLEGRKPTGRGRRPPPSQVRESPRGSLHGYAPTHGSQVGGHGQASTPRIQDVHTNVIGSRPASWKCILSPGFQDRSRRDPKYVPRARHFCVIEVIILPFQICDRIFQRVTSDSIKCNGSFVRSLYGRICRGGQGGDREIARDRGWLRGVVWSGRVGLLHVCTNHN